MPISHLYSRNPQEKIAAVYEILFNRLYEACPELKKAAFAEEDEKIAVLMVQVYMTLQTFKRDSEKEQAIYASLEAFDPEEENSLKLDKKLWDYLENNASSRLIKDVLKALPSVLLDRQEKAFVLFALNHQDPSVRFVALENAAQNDAPEIFSAILSSTLDRDLSVSKRAYNLLSLMPPAFLSRSLENALNCTDSKVLDTISLFLPKIATPSLKDTLRKASVHPERKVREKGLEALKILSSSAETSSDSILSSVSHKIPDSSAAEFVSKPSASLKQPAVSSSAQEIFVQKAFEKKTYERPAVIKMSDRLLKKSSEEKEKSNVQAFSISEPVQLEKPEENVTQSKAEAEALEKHKEQISQLAETEAFSSSSDESISFLEEDKEALVVNHQELNNTHKELFEDSELNSEAGDFQETSDSLSSLGLPEASDVSGIDDILSLGEFIEADGSQDDINVLDIALGESLNLVDDSSDLESSMSLEELPKVSVESANSISDEAEVAFVQSDENVNLSKESNLEEEFKAENELEIGESLQPFKEPVKLLGKSDLREKKMDLKINPAVASIIKSSPYFISNTLELLYKEKEPELCAEYLRNFAVSFVAFLEFTYMQSALFYGQRSPLLLETAKGMLTGKAGTALAFRNIQNYLAALPRNTDEPFFTFSMAAKLSERSEDNPLFLLRELFAFLEQPSEQTPENLKEAAEGVIKILSEFTALKKNQILIKGRKNGKIVFWDLSSRVPKQTGGGIIGDDLPEMEPVLLSKDAREALGLFPYFSLGEKGLVYTIPKQSELEELKSRLE